MSNCHAQNSIIAIKQYTQFFTWRQLVQTVNNSADGGGGGGETALKLYSHLFNAA